MNKFRWYLGKLLNFLWAFFNLLLYFLFHPRLFKTFLFSFFTSVNEFHQVAYGRLKNFEETRFFKELAGHFIFAQSNLFNRDTKVTKSMETHFLATLVKELAPQNVFEIGTYNGFTTLHLAVNSPPNANIFTLDLPPDYDIDKIKAGATYDDLLVIKFSQETINKRVYQKSTYASKIHELYGDSAVFDFSPYCGKMDIVFIDGNHSSSYIKSDTENAFKMLSDIGVIVWHDFDYIIHKEVFSYLNELAKSYSIYSVPYTRFAIYGKKME